MVPGKLQYGGRSTHMNSRFLEGELFVELIADDKSGEKILAVMDDKDDWH